VFIIVTKKQANSQNKLYKYDEIPAFYQYSLLIGCDIFFETYRNKCAGNGTGVERPPETQALEAEPTSGEEDDLLLTDNHIEAGDLFLLQQAPSHLGLPAPAAASGLDFSAVRPVSGLDSSAPSDFSAAVAGLTSVVSTSRPGPSSSSGFKKEF
jgi:hypothetical protein